MRRTSVVVVVLAGLSSLSCSAGGAGRDDVSLAASATTTSTVPTSVSVPAPSPSASLTVPPNPLDATYEACAVAAGFDPGGVQVLMSAAGVPEWVKTGRDVPTRVHSPCFVRIGGRDPRHSSHGNP